ncbi:MAG: carboxypeptidase regulatory-like domain-containing protein [Ruminococcus sp.]|nr:carboxypeptidase regulatory-like domain-containing protein [Ruminococcus sp.]
MDNKDINAQAEKYRLEMMKLYGRRCEDKEDKENKNEEIYETDPKEGENFPQGANPDIEEEEYTPPDEDMTEIPPENAPLPDNDNLPEDTAFSPYIEEDAENSKDIEENFNSRYPDPELSSLDTDYGTSEEENITPPEYVSEESLGSKKGYIVVNVRTGDESSAVAGATVLVTAIVDGNRMILANGLTNQNGTTPVFEVPVPDLELSQSPYPNQRPYNLYDVSVTAEGYFNARSVDVPVFESITSVQNFNMIPVPSMMRENDETLTYFNQEPEFPNKPDENGV